MQLSAPELEALRDHLLKELPNSPRVLLLGGSVLEGFATSRSDYDVVAILDQRPAIEEGRRALLNLRFNGRRCEVIFRGLDEVRRLVVFGDRCGISNEVDHIEERRRIVCGQVLFGQDCYEQTLAGFSMPAFRDHICDVYYRIAEQRFEDIVGFVAEERWIEARLAARQYFETVCDCVLVAADDMYLRRKWRIPRIWRTFSRYPALEGVASNTIDSLLGCNPSAPIHREAVGILCAQALWFTYLVMRPSALAAKAPEFLPHADIDRPLALLPRGNSRVLLRTTTSAFELDTKMATLLAWQLCTSDPVPDEIGGDAAERSIPSLLRACRG